MSTRHDLPITVAVVRKNGLEEIRVSLDSYNGHDLLDVRTYADFSGAGERRATKKGISLRVDALPELITALHKAEAQARGRGLNRGVWP